MLFCFPLNCNTVHITETNQSCSKHHVQPAETIVECVNMLQAIKLQVYFTRLCCCAVVEDSGLSVNLGSLEEQKEAEVYHRVVTVSSLHPQDTQNQKKETHACLEQLEELPDGTGGPQTCTSPGEAVPRQRGTR
ncbi:uncharacterized protein LOC109102541 isoform X2 [Cyprinus carpio]|uniref:Uncharacterized protein LOC109102541 isoform X2 n=1 Tax=Cyprinus carpio TaxID=7962 RepID=A0A9Q9Z194_CYPCA|nr:uncharacterized protein LOC109102541 isoform X2 [Cyprinus carpio]